MSTDQPTPLQKLEARLKAGLIDQAAFDAVKDLVISQHPSGSAIAFGEKAVAVAAGAVNNGGDNNGLINVGTLHVDTWVAAAQAPGATPQQLRLGYLSRIWSQANQLPLFGGDDTRHQISLSSIYTALLTTASKEDDVDGVMSKLNSSREQAHKSASALDVLNAEKKLVLLSGPGGGKSTFVNFMSLSMAGEMLSRPDANLATLTAPVPQLDKDKTEKPKPQRWDHGALLPVHIVLRDFAAQLPDVGAEVNASTVLDHIKLNLKSAGIEKFFDSLHAELLGPGCLVLLDGLDEVPDVKGRRLQIKQAVQGFADTFANCRFLVTSRTYAYQNQEWKLDGFHAVQLLPFTRAQIARFADAWYAHMVALNRLTEGVAKARADVLKREVARNSRIHELAARPLLLTLMARLQTDEGGSLPEKREALYDKSVEMLLNTWETMKVRTGTDGKPEVEPSLTEWLSASRDNIRKQLNRLAFEAHRDQVGLKGTASLAQAALIDALLNASANRSQVKVGALEDYLRDRAGILTAKANKLYEFPHRTFQEYLAACHLTDDDFPENLVALVRSENDINRWREVTLLAAATAARGGQLGVWALAEALCPMPAPVVAGSLSDQYCALLAGCTLHEAADLTTPSPANQIKLNRIRDWQVHIMRSGQLPSSERALAGRSLARLGDLRPEVATLDGMQFCLVPGGDFLMGDGDQSQTIDLPEPYLIARFPVTTAQWQEHLAESSGKSSLEIESRYSAQRGNDPVTLVTWKDAMEFCQAMTKRWNRELPEGYVVSLPTEPEWEKAARGGTFIPTQHHVVGLDAIPAVLRKAEQLNCHHNPKKTRKYPWTGSFNTDLANADASIGSISAVGCFPAGVSPYGCEEMSGNVWEWTLAKHRSHPCKTTREILDLEIQAKRVLRGASWENSEATVRCAYRMWHPGGDLGSDLGFRVVLRPYPRTADSEVWQNEGLN
jgi:formylglycine-generating enzyme required for sulfatase activity